MANLIKAITTGVGGISTTADASGAITFQKDSTTTATIDASGNFAAAGNISTPTGTITASSFVGNGSGLTGLASAQIQTELFTSPGTWSKPASATQVRVTVIGAGGGGGAWAPVGSIPGKAGGSGGFIMAMAPVSAPVAITVGSGGVGGAQIPTGNPGTSGGTSSFGSAVSSTGGGGGGGPAFGTDGTGTVSTGTAIKTGIAGTPSPTPTANRAVYGLPALGIFGGTQLAVGSPAAVAFSTSSLNGAGAGGAGTGGAAGNGGGGIGGAVLVEFVG